MFKWDEAKWASNLAKHGVDFSDTWRLAWDGALTVEDPRGPYGEDRLISIMPLGERLHVCVWTWRGASRRIISLRKANEREAARYGQWQALH